MALDSYTGLITAVQDFLGRGDASTARVDYGIDLCESWLNKELRVKEMEAQTSTLTVTDGVITHPANWLSWKQIGLTVGGSRYQLRPMTLEQRSYFDDGSTDTPQWYVLRSGGTLLVPKPDASYTWDATFYEKIPALSGSQTSNWALSSYPDAYLYGTLAAMEGFYVGDQRIPLWKSLAEEALRGIRRASQDYGQVLTMRPDTPTY